MSGLFRLPGLFSGIFALLLFSTGIPVEEETPAAGAAGTAVAGHRGKITALVPAGDDEALSAGEDGFLGIWDTQTMSARDRFQLSPWPITAMAPRPGHPEIALIESDGIGLYRISAWNYREKRNLFKLRFRDSISFISYSAGGSFIIVSRSGRTGTVFIHPETGAVLQSPENLTGLVSFAATGRSERNMIAYAPSGGESRPGSLSYWDIETGAELRRFEAPAHMESPLLFGNNRFFGGFDGQGLVILDAASGVELARERTLLRGRLIPAPAEETGFFCIAAGSPASGETLYYFTLSPTGALDVKGSLLLPEPLAGLSSAVWIQTDAPAAPAPSSRRDNRNGRTTAVESILAGQGAALILGTTEGRVYRLLEPGTAAALSTGSQVPVRNAAVSGESAVFITGNGFTGMTPRDYTALREGEPLSLYPAGPYRRAASDSGSADSGGFVFWQDQTVQDAPVVKQTPGEGGTPFYRLSINLPLTEVSVLGKQALFLDSAGGITVVSTETGRTVFTFSSAGSLDAAFLDDRNIVIGRSSVSGGTPFLKINIRTGETVPLPYPAAVGLGLYRGGSGTLYAVAIEIGGAAAKTTIIALDANRPAQSQKLVEYQDEDSSFSFAESSGAFASTMGGDGATLYRDGVFYPFERSPGLPALLIDGGIAFIAVDGEGNITWHSAYDGSLLALLRIRADRWELENRNENLIITGPVEYATVTE